MFGSSFMATTNRQHRMTLATVKNKKPTGCAGRIDLTHEVLPEREDGQE